MEFFLGCGEYIVGILIGVMIIAIGVKARHKEKAEKNSLVRATVVNCTPSETRIRGMSLQCFEIELEFTSDYGIIHKSMKRGEPIDIGTVLDVRYNRKDDTVEMPEITKNKTNILPGVMIALGSIVTATFFVLFFIKGFETNDKAAAHLLAIIFCLPFVFVGLHTCVIHPAKRKHMLLDCDIVQGKVASRVVFRRYWSFFSSYVSIYEYGYHGEVRRVGAASRSPRKEPLGKIVTIAVNRKTGEAYCIEEQKKYYIVGGIFALAGLLMIGVCIWSYYL